MCSGREAAAFMIRCHCTLLAIWPWGRQRGPQWEGGGPDWCVCLPDGVVGGVRVVGGDPPDGGAHPGVFGDHHPGERHGEDGRLIHVLHRHLDGRGVAEGAQAQEVGVDVPVCGFDPQREAALCLKVQGLAGKTNVGKLRLPNRNVILQML